MKLFDVIGALAVATWVVLGGVYVYHTEYAAAPKTRAMGKKLVMDEGETWLVLRRDDKDVGFVHQTRTQLTHGWLLESDMLITINVLGSEQPIDTNVKSRLDPDGYLEQFNAKLTVSGRHIKASGNVDGKTLHTTLVLGDNPTVHNIKLQERPRLSSSAFNQLLAGGDLKAGETYREKFFDPTTMHMTDMVMVYKGKEKIDVFGKKYQAHHIVQKVSGNTLDAYVDDNGEVLIQEFPLKMVGARVPKALGQTRAAAIRRELKERQKKQASSKDGGLQLNLGTAMKVLGGQIPGMGNSKKHDGAKDANTQGGAEGTRGGSETTRSTPHAPDAKPRAPGAKPDSK